MYKDIDDVRIYDKSDFEDEIEEIDEIPDYYYDKMKDDIAEKISMEG